MTMLSIALQQIQLTSWWECGQEIKFRKISGALKANALEKRNERKAVVLDFIKSSNKGLLARDICKQTSIPRASVQSILDELRQDGLIVADTTMVRCTIAHVLECQKMNIETVLLDVS